MRRKDILEKARKQKEAIGAVRRTWQSLGHRLDYLFCNGNEK